MSKPIPTLDKYMTPAPLTVDVSTTLSECQRVMSEHRVRHLPVLDGAKLAGILSDRDLTLIEALQGSDPRVLVAGDAMTPSPYHVSPRASLDEVVSEMAERKYGSAVVVDNDKVVGIFTAVDALSAFAHLLQTRLAK